jgi:hypothetical protein
MYFCGARWFPRFEADRRVEADRCVVAVVRPRISAGDWPYDRLELLRCMQIRRARMRY